ncbi:hypothetical protein CU048_03580 [Beijerinckiaceae bacterium]|nr:hypothetical protein CU048_03580 [Beijerinckiaceae bacterium]
MPIDVKDRDGEPLRPQQEKRCTVDETGRLSDHLLVSFWLWFIRRARPSSTVLDGGSRFRVKMLQKQRSDAHSVSLAKRYFLTIFQ